MSCPLSWVRTGGSAQGHHEGGRVTAGHAVGAPGSDQGLLCSPRIPVAGDGPASLCPSTGRRGAIAVSQPGLSEQPALSQPSQGCVASAPEGHTLPPAQRHPPAQGGAGFTEQPGCRLAAAGGLMPARGHLTLHVPPHGFVRVPLVPLPATSCPAGAAWCQSGPTGARCQMHKEGLSATRNTEGVDFRPGKRGHKGPGPGRGMCGCAPAPCQWHLCSEYKRR